MPSNSSFSKPPISWSTAQARPVIDGGALSSRNGSGELKPGKFSRTSRGGIAAPVAAAMALNAKQCRRGTREAK